MKKSYNYVAILDFSSKHIFIKFPDFEEAVSQADTTEEALRCAKEALQLSIESRLEDGEAIPDPTPLEAVELDEKQRTSIISIVLEDKIKYDKKTLTIPHDLNVAAEAAGINFSQLLQQAIREKISKLEI